MRIAVLLSLLLVATIFAADPAADNWPHWRGPLANGTSPTTDPPIKWDVKTHVKWTVDVPGKGSASPIVWGDQVFVLTAVDTDRSWAAPCSFIHRRDESRGESSLAA